MSRTAARGRGGSARRSGATLRPTASRVRDALFNRLGARIDGAAVLDLYAGTGAMGVEALRRGAARAVFVEHDPAHARKIRQELLRGGLEARAEVRCEDALAAVARLSRSGRVFDLIIMDPPYGRGWLTRALTAVGGAGMLAPDGLVVAEGHWRDRPEVPSGLILDREARYGETMLWFFRPQTRQ